MKPGDDEYKARYPGRPRTTGVFDTLEELREAVEKYWDDGWSTGRIARRVGVSRKTIYNLMGRAVDKEQKPE